MKVLNSTDMTLHEGHVVLLHLVSVTLKLRVFTRSFLVHSVRYHELLLKLNVLDSRFIWRRAYIALI
jgi:hypothetical protein